MKRSISFVILLIVCCLLVWLGKAIDFNSENTEPVPDSVLFTTAPVLTPRQALHTFDLADGFAIEVVASEPLVQDPVAMTFDARGRIWVVEMRGYMQNITGIGEDQKVGRIVILEDEDGNGIMDHSKIFMDGLIMPRAIAVVNGGILYAEPPNLWFVENIGDKPGRKQLIDSTFAVGGNAEHQANGLMRGIDNWYYNAKSSKRYRYQGGQWVKEETEFRGQWGITKDNYGRLFYNTNSNQLRGDLVPPNTLSRNSDFSPDLGVNVEIAEDQNVYPIRPTPGVNRGYKEETLDDSLRLQQFTAACSPLIYRGDNFPEAYEGNAFVCEPAGNLVKRNILFEKGTQIEARQAYTDHEFLASTDERFRPVGLYNAPDGSLYLVDMYRGVIQHKTYLTDYLRGQIMSRDLEKPIGFGRIYRIVYQKSWFSEIIDNLFDPQQDLYQATNQELVSYLSHANGWLRDNAQRLLVERNDKAVVPDIIDVLKDADKLGKIHALWTLEGMGEITPEVVELGVKAKEPKVVATAVRVGEKIIGKGTAKKVLGHYALAAATDSPIVQLQLALSLGQFMHVDAPKVLDMLKVIAVKHGDDPLTREAIMSSLYEKENQFLALLKQESPTTAMISFLDNALAKRRLKNELTEKELSTAEKEQYITGKALFTKTCAACHNQDGKGLVPIAPPLAGSEWVTGPEDRLVLIVLHGLKGPVTVNGKVYKVPEVQPLMPGLYENPEFTDDKIAALLTYIRNAWSNQASTIEAATVQGLRKRFMDRTEPFTAGELMKQ